MMSVLLTLVTMLGLFIQSSPSVQAVKVSQSSESDTIRCYECTNCEPDEPNDQTKICEGEVCVQIVATVARGAFMLLVMFRANIVTILKLDSLVL